MKKKMKDLNPTRREFLTTTGVATAGSVLAGIALMPKAHAAGTDAIKVAVIGCGGRGSGAAINCIEAGGNVKIIAVADAFEEKAKACAEMLGKKGGDKVEIAPERIFSGLDAFQKAIDCGVDMVILATPPGFRPQHFEAAVKASKNIFMEKPVCVCPAGYRRVIAAAKIADEKNLKVGVGLQRHHQSGYLGRMAELADGKLGELTLLRGYWNGNGIWNRPRQPGMSEMQFQVNNWYHFVWLSGDNICEQHIHNIDVCNWAISAAAGKSGADYMHPIEANGMGASLTRGYNGKDVQGQLFDAHSVEFIYPGGIRMISQCRHQPGTWSNVSEAIHTTKNLGGINASGEGPKLQHGNPYVQEHYDLQQAIANNTPYNEAYIGATSSMTSVMGRYATYTGQIIKWDELIAKPDDTFPTQLSWDAKPPVVPDENGFYPIPTPGLGLKSKKA
jgi:myo-inositol 2-dehydrogenase / D-chiro-inositol 1-dehydrogenase